MDQNLTFSPCILSPYKEDKSSAYQATNVFENLYKKGANQKRKSKQAVKTT